MGLPEPFESDHPFLPPDTFKDGVIFITGGGTGLGKAMATAFARLGGSVAVVSRKAEHRAAGIAAVEAAGGKACGIACDIRHPEQVAAAFDEAESKLGPVSVLVNNAAGRFMAPAEDITPNGWRAVTQIVLDGTFFCSREFHKRRLAAERPGAILNIGATYAWTGGPGSAHSAAAKAAVSNLTQTLAIEWGIDGVRINTLAPGYFPHEDQVEHMKGSWSKDRDLQMPAGRAGRLQELGWAACFLCSPFASYITGHTLVVDGGNWLRHRASSQPNFVPVREWARRPAQG